MVTRVNAFRASGLHDVLYNLHRNFVLRERHDVVLPRIFPSLDSLWFSIHDKLMITDALSLRLQHFFLHRIYYKDYLSILSIAPTL